MDATTVKDQRMFSLIVLYDMHTRYFRSALDGIRDEDAHKRLDTKANHVAWLTGSLVQQRYDIANKLGVAGQQAANDLFKENQGIKDNVTYPSLDQFRKDWDAISPKLREAFCNVTTGQLNAKFEMMPGYQMSNYELITFMIYREANCIGQIALWRRLLGYEGMKYM